MPHSKHKYIYKKTEDQKTGCEQTGFAACRAVDDDLILNMWYSHL